MTQNNKTVGVIMLDTRFPRLVGDIGNPKGFPFDVIYQTVMGASPERIVEQQDEEMLAPFIEAGQDLIAKGADVITTSCGFLACFQKEMQTALQAPVYTSALLMLPDLEAKYGTGKVGILTISRQSMHANFRQKALQSRTDLVIGGPKKDSEFARKILSDAPSFDVEQCESDLVEAATRLTRENKGIEAILLECTNMAPHADAIKAATGRLNFALNDLLNDVVLP